MRKVFWTALLAALWLSVNATAQALEATTRCAALGYFDGKDRLVSAPLLAGPLVDGTRISDEWGWRLHPILHLRAFHFGVDIAAPLGTPIHAVADGVVIEARRKGLSGLFVRIRHNRVYETGFAHVSAFAPGIRPGVRVKRGQVVAFVGSTGLSTGNHLHFEIYVNRSRVRPACSCGAVLLAAHATRSRVVVLQRHAKPLIRFHPKRRNNQ